jgi:hypothetical protein
MLLICENCGSKIRSHSPKDALCWPCARNKANERRDYAAISKKVNSINPSIQFHIQDGFIEFTFNKNECAIIPQGPVREVLFPWIDTEEKFVAALERVAEYYGEGE